MLNANFSPEASSMNLQKYGKAEQSFFFLVNEKYSVDKNLTKTKAAVSIQHSKVLLQYRFLCR